MDQGPTVEFRDWLLNDLLVELHHTRPIIDEKKNEDESVSHEVRLEDGAPVLESSVVGVSFVAHNSVGPKARVISIFVEPRPFGARYKPACKSTIFLPKIAAQVRIYFPQPAHNFERNRPDHDE